MAFERICFQQFLSPYCVPGAPGATKMCEMGVYSPAGSQVTLPHRKEVNVMVRVTVCRMLSGPLECAFHA